MSTHTQHQARLAVEQAVGAQNVGPFVGKLGNGFVYVVAPSKRAVVSEGKVQVYRAAK